MYRILSRSFLLATLVLFSGASAWAKSLTNLSFGLGLIREEPAISSGSALTVNFQSKAYFVSIAGEIDTPVQVPVEWPSYSLTKTSSLLPVEPNERLRSHGANNPYAQLSVGVPAPATATCEVPAGVTQADFDADPYLNWCLTQSFLSPTLSVTRTLLEYIPYAAGDITGDGYPEVFVPALGAFITNFYGEKDSKLPPFVHSQYDEFQGVQIRTHDENGKKISQNTFSLEDLNGDGLKDLVVFRPNAAPLVAYNEWSGVFSKVQLATRYLSSTYGDMSTVLSAVAGEFGVDGAAASYTVPIAAPTGTAEVAPKLAISYSSGGPGGLLGTGWSIDGSESSITRCGMAYIDRPVSNADAITSAAGGARSTGVRYSNTADKLCLDGQQLTLVSGTYWASGAVYAPRQDSAAKVVQVGAAGAGYFVVYDKSGDKRYYGQSSFKSINTNSKLCLSTTGGSAACASGTLLYEAALSGVEDKVGNYIAYEYDTAQTANFVLALKTIHYTGNESQNLLPYNKIQFNYENRPDARYEYIYGVRSLSGKRLESVATYAEGEKLYREYRLFYLNDNLTGDSQLIALTECVANKVCAKPTTFDWTTSMLVDQLQFDQTNKVNNLFSNASINEDYDAYSIQYPDINGDGRTDACGRQTSGVTCVLSTSNGFLGGETISTPICKDNGTGGDSPCSNTEHYNSVRYLDLNGDGLDDILWLGANAIGVAYTEKVAASVRLGTANALKTYPLLGNSTFSQNATTVVAFADRLGDGIPQLCTQSKIWGVQCYARSVPSTPSGIPFYYLGDSGGWNGPWGVFNANICTSTDATNGGCNGEDNYKTLTYLDFDADGRSDIVYRSDAGMRMHRTGSSLVETKICANGTDCDKAQSYRYPDLNGDGLPEFCYVTNTGSALKCHVNTGVTWSGDFSVIEFDGTANVIAGLTTGISFSDINDDGLEDLIVSKRSQIGIYINSGQRSDNSFGFSLLTSLTDTQLNSEDNWQTVSVVDTNGDGVKDIVYRADDGLVTRFFKTKELPNYLTKITNGFGVKTYIKYSNLFDPSVYTPSTGEQYPLAQIKGQYTVVKSVESSGNSSKNQVTNYSYTGLRQHLTGAGFLGFEKVNANRQYSNPLAAGGTQAVSESIETTYSTDWSRHRAGLPISTVKKINGVTVKQTTNTYKTNIVSASHSIDATKTTAWGAFDSGLRYFVYPGDTTTKTYEPTTGTLITTERLENTIGAFGNTTYTKHTVSGGSATYITETTNTYDNENTANWYLGKVSSTTVKKSGTDRSGGAVATQTRISTWSYDPTTGAVTAERTLGGNTLTSPAVIEVQHKTETTHGGVSYGDFGLRNVVSSVSTATVGSDKSTRTARTFYDKKGRFPELVVDALGFETKATFDYVKGVKTSETDINGLVSRWEYDAFGRVIQQKSPIGIVVDTRYIECYFGCPAGAIYYVESQESAESSVPTVQGISRVYIDKFGREVLKTTHNGFGAEVGVKTTYDTDGRIASVSEPYFVAEGEPSLFTKTFYDASGRIIKVINPDGTDVEYAYDGLKTTYTNELNQQKIDQEEPNGLLWKTQDAVGNTITYQYDAQGNNLKATTKSADSSGEYVINMQYDFFGRKIEMTDPSKGTWSYVYNSRGELVLQTDANQKRICNVYDVAGRLVARVDDYASSNTADDAKDGCKNGIPTARWIYDQAPKVDGGQWKGKLYKIVDDTINYEQVFSYTDIYGLLAYTTEKIDGYTYKTSYTYDSRGRVETTTYPSRYADVAGKKQLKIKNIYNDYGALSKIQDISVTGTLSSPITLWEPITVNARGQVENESLSGGFITVAHTYKDADASLTGIKYSAWIKGEVHREDYVFDAVGNLTSREVTAPDPANAQKTAIHWQEQFSYDSLNRMQTVEFKDHLAASNNKATNPEYLWNGNIKSMDDKGASSRTYDYATIPQTCANKTAKPHAVSRLMDGSTVYKSYCYDAVGNMVSSSDGRSISWNAAGYPTRMAKGTNYVDIVYGPDRGRLKRTDKAGADITVTTYVGGAYEYIKKPDGAIEEKLYIAGIGLLTVKNGDFDAPGTTYRYYFKDHLGSVVGVINSAFNANGLEIDRMAYDPWGKRRKYMDNTMALVTMTDAELLGLMSRTSKLKTTRGFTGHEMLDTVGLVHMNGRVYDPDIGRFVSADPVVQDATDVQAFNRYAYVRNNPVSLTDPSGFSWISKKWKQVRHGASRFYRFLQRGVKNAFTKIGRELARNEAFATVARIVACLPPWAAATCVPVNAFISASTTYAVTGNWHMAFRAGVVAAASAYASQYVNGKDFTGNWLDQAFLNGAIGGASSAAMGGSFGVGFRSSFISSVISGAYARSSLGGAQGMPGIIGSSIVGGTISALTGGKFASGAMTGAFQAIAAMAASELGSAAAAESKPCTTCPCNTSGPIEFNSGRKWLEISDAQVGRLEFKRFYNSFAHGDSALGGVWRHSFERQLILKSYEVELVNADGRKTLFQPAGDGWRSKSAPDLQLKELDSGEWQLATAENTLEIYDATGHLQRVEFLGGYTQTLHYNDQGQLILVTDNDNRALTFKYRADGKLYSVTTSAGDETVYRYNSQGMLAGVIRPDATPGTLADNARLAYLYEDGRFPQALTGYIDEAGERYGTWQYDDQMRGSYEHTEGLNENTLVYNDDGSTTVTTALGRATTYHFNDDGKTINVEGHATDSCVGSNNAYDYDANGFIAAKTDWNGIRTEYVHDARGRELRRTEAVGRPEQYTVETTWHDLWKLPVRIVAPGLTTEFDYDDTGLLLAKREIDTTQPAPEGVWAKLTHKPSAREWHYSYNPQGMLASVDGPRAEVNDITRYAYDAQGNQTVIENALGHTLQVLSHTAAGLPETLRDPNGTQTQLEYSAHGWLTAKTVTTATGDTARTEYAYSPIVQYDGTGLLSQVTSPTGAVLTYNYNADRKLSSVANGQGERIDYALDAMGNVTAQTVYSAQGEIVRQHAQAFDELSRLIGEISAEGYRTTHHYDKNGNRVESIDALGRATRIAYDGLNRVSSVTDALGGVTRTDYTARGDIAQVIDARGITTRYERNGFGEVVKQISQDTGTTTFAYDAAGNLVTRTDARGVVTQYRYDALNRLLAVHYPADSTLDVAYHYDNTSALGVGRLDRVSDQTGQRAVAYDGRGNVVAEAQVIGQARYALGYGYDAADRLISEAYPSGHVLALSRNAEGQVTAFSLNKDGVSRPILGEVDYQAFGGIEALRWGNGLEEQRAWTQDGRLALQAIERLSHKDYTYDAVGNLVSIADRLQATNDRHYGYDELDRLVSSRNGTDGVELFAYDAVGNRKTYERVEQGETVVAEAYRYDTQSNRLLEVTRGSQARVLGYDAVGNTVKDQGFEGKARVLDYGVDNRLKSVDDGVTYWHNAEGQRVIARGDKGLKHLVYDVQDRLVAEANADGAVVREYYYLDRVPVAMLDVANDQLYFVHGDHLGTPKLVTGSDGSVVWSGEALAFGGTKVDGSVGLDFRFPGQVEDGATGYFYNYFRDYDATVGRYLQSDPIGLAAGVNTYGYVLENPLGSVDEFGLEDMCMAPVHGNSLDNGRPSHVYEIFYTDENGVTRTWKWGVSSGPLNLDGSSSRANIQVNALNRANPNGPVFSSDVLDANVTRRYALQSEYNRTANYVKNNGAMPPGMKRPVVGGSKADFSRNIFNGNNLVY